MITLAVLTDGRRECVKPTVSSLFDGLVGVHYPGVMVDDSGDSEYGTWLEKNCGRWFSYSHHPKRLGISASLRDLWTMAVAHPRTEFVFHTEDDFVVPEKVDVTVLAYALMSQPSLGCLGLKRGPVNDQEQAAGGMCQAHPELFTETRTPSGFAYVAYSHLFSTNPCLIPRAVIESCLSLAELSEDAMGKALVEQGYHFGLVGRIADEPLVEHVGSYRMEGWTW